MSCKLCKTKPVIQLTNSNIKLCKSCFIKYFERKVIKTIRKYNLINKDEKIITAISGGKDSLTILYILNKYYKNRIKLEALLVNEGIKGYRDLTIKEAKRFCKENKIKLNIISFKKEFGYDLDSLVKKFKIKPCSICGVLKRNLLNKYAKKLKADKLVTGHNLDDEAQSVLMNMFKNNIQISARLGPITGIREFEGFVRRIKPLYFLTEKETSIYANLRKFSSDFGRCPYSNVAYRKDVMNFINKFENKYEGTKHAIINSFLKVLPLLKEKYKTESELKLCKKCKQPCEGEICKACEIINKLKNNQICSQYL